MPFTDEIQTSIALRVKNSQSDLFMRYSIVSTEADYHTSTIALNPPLPHGYSLQGSGEEPSKALPRTNRRIHAAAALPRSLSCDVQQKPP